MIHSNSGRARDRSDVQLGPSQRRQPLVNRPDPVTSQRLDDPSPGLGVQCSRGHLLPRPKSRPAPLARQLRQERRHTGEGRDSCRKLRSTTIRLGRVEGREQLRQLPRFGSKLRWSMGLDGERTPDGLAISRATLQYPPSASLRFKIISCDGCGREKPTRRRVFVPPPCRSSTRLFRVGIEHRHVGEAGREPCRAKPSSSATAAGSPFICSISSCGRRRRGGSICPYAASGIVPWRSEIGAVRRDIAI